MQPIYAHRLDSKIYLYEDKVNEMIDEFKERLERKRTMINKIKHKCKELSVKDATLLCDKCNQDVGLLKTLTFINEELHHARSVFGFLNRVEIQDALKNENGYYSDKDNADFIELYKSIFEEKKMSDQVKGVKNVYDKPRYAFAECRSHHMLGIIEDEKYYFTDISPLKIMFPQATYEEWSSKFWQPGYTEAMMLQNKLNLKRAQDSRILQHGRLFNDSVKCDICN